MSLGQSIRSGVKWLVAGKLGSRLFEFAFGVILARLLVPADFGMLATVSALTGFVGLLATGGLGQALVRAKNADEHDFNVVFTLQLALGVMAYLGFFIAAPFLARFFEDPVYKDLIRVSALSFLLRPFPNLRGAWLNREMQFKKATLIGVATGLFTGVSSCLMAWAGMGVWSLVLSGLAGALLHNFMLGFITPLRFRLHPNIGILSRHSSYGMKITLNELLSYFIRESKNLVLSKLAGPAFLGLFNKGESLSRLPNQLMMSATMQPLFRALSKVQDDLDTSKYMFHRTITLMMVYTLPLYVGLWWVAEPFILVVYGDKWVTAAEAMRILILVGVMLNVLTPCGVLLDAQNRLGQEMVALIIRLAITILACLVGVQWGLAGVAWALVATYVFSTVYYYALVTQVIRTSMQDLLRSMTPALTLNGLLFLVLAATDHALGEFQVTRPAVYLLAMAATGAVFYSSIFLFLPISALRTESERWRQLIGSRLSLVFRARS